MTSQSDNVSIQPVLPSPVLPEELIYEILLRLPVKSLLQLKCVCKSWKTLISDSQFAKNHLRFPSLTNQRLVFLDEEEPNKMLSYPLKQLLENSSTPVKQDTLCYVKNRKYHILGLCNGLLCLYYHCQHRVRLYNPSTRFKSKKSPVLVSYYWDIKQFGFGYDQVNDKYKVLLVVPNENDPTQTLTKIYTFGENFCKTIPKFSLNRILYWLGKFVSGTLNWLVEKRGVSPDQDLIILSFDLEKETYSEVLMPHNNDDGDFYSRKLYVLSNCLCVFDIYYTKIHQWDLWMMKEYGVAESWTKQMIINESRPCLAFVEPLFILDNGVSILLANNSSDQIVLYHNSSNQIVLYHLNSDGITTSSISYKPFAALHIHRESLVSHL